MAGITTGIGLITGIPIADTVDQLIELEAVSRNNLASRTETLLEEQLAVNELTAFLYSIKTVTASLSSDTTFDRRTVTSNDESIMTARVTGSTEADGDTTYTVLQTAQPNQWLANGVFDQTASLGGGTFSFRFGPRVTDGTPLELFNEGTGLERGSFQITDRSGVTGTIDLSTAFTLEDVLDEINNNTSINVIAEAHGDGIRLTDRTGKSDSNLIVSEIGLGETAASLGLVGINTSDTMVDGDDLIGLYEGMSLELLNDGQGVDLAWEAELGDLEYTLADGTTGTLDLTPQIGGFEEDEEAVYADPPKTLGELVEAINAAEPGKLQVEIAPDGERLIAKDLTAGAGTFELTSKDGTMSDLIADLGLDGTPVAGEITGRRLMGGSGSVLLSSLNGGAGLGTLGTLDLTDRSGATDSVDLSGAETLEEAIDLINAAGVDLVASYNQAENGIRLTDTSGATAGNLIVANGDATNTADLLGLTIDEATDSVDSGDQHLQVISRQTKLADLNGGKGISDGDFTIIDASGAYTTLDFSHNETATLDQLIMAVSQGTAQVRLEINETGDGLRIIDESGGTGTLRVEEGDSTTAADLGLLGESATETIEGEEKQVLRANGNHQIALDAEDSLEDLVEKINDLDVGVTGSIFNDGSANGYRLMLRSNTPGQKGEILVDSSELGLSFRETVEAQDALISIGDPEAGVLVASSDNTFEEVIPGVTFEVYKASDEPVTLTVSRSDVSVVAGAQVLVENYNRFIEHYNELSKYDEATNTAGLLFKDTNTRWAVNDLNLLLTDSISGVGSVKTLSQVGITMNSNGTLTFDENTLKEVFVESPEDLRAFFASGERDDDSVPTMEELLNEDAWTAPSEPDGFAIRLERLVESIAGIGTSAFAQRNEALENQIVNNERRIVRMDVHLESKRERLLADFFAMESAIAKLNNNLTVVQELATSWESSD